MNMQAQEDCDVLLKVNLQLELLYYEQQNPWVALHLSRNYHLLEAQDDNISQQSKWHEKAQGWWTLYWRERGNKCLKLFYDADGLSY